MKTLTVLFSVLAMAQTASAATSLDLDCNYSSRGSATSSSAHLQDGNVQSTCPEFICQKVWEVNLNYNDTYKSIDLQIENKVTGQYTKTTIYDLKLNSNFEFGTTNLKTGEDLSVECEVVKVQ